MTQLENDQIASMRAAVNLDEMQAAIVMNINVRLPESAQGRIRNVRAECGENMVRVHKLGKFVPIYDRKRNCINLLGETYKVGRGQNGAGVRFIWHFADQWTRSILQKHGFSRRAAYMITGVQWDYLHRTLPIIQLALDGKFPDPQVNVMLPSSPRRFGTPVNLSVEENDADTFRRATRECPCGGTLFDWGSSCSNGWDYVSWHCNGCPRTFTEWLADGQLYAMRGGRNPPHPVTFADIQDIEKRSAS